MDDVALRFGGIDRLVNTDAGLIGRCLGGKPTGPNGSRCPVIGRV